MAEGVNAAARIAESYKKLAGSAQLLNAASDGLAKQITSLDLALQRLNLGVIAWERVQGIDDDGTGCYWSRDVGYTKIGSRWGLALRTREGSHQQEEDTVEEWLFNDSPRHMRIDAIDKIPDLVEKLIKASEKTARKLQEKTAQAGELAAAVTAASTELAKTAKEKR